MAAGYCERYKAKYTILATSVFLYYPPGLPEIKSISLALILVDRQKFGQTAAKCKEYLLLLFSKIFKSNITIIIINTTITLVVKWYESV